MEEEEEVVVLVVLECCRFPRGVFPGMKSLSIYSPAGCYLFSCSADTQRYCSLSRVLAGVLGSVVFPVSDVCGLWVRSSS